MVSRRNFAICTISKYTLCPPSNWTKRLVSGQPLARERDAAGNPRPGFDSTQRKRLYFNKSVGPFCFIHHHRRLCGENQMKSDKVVRVQCSLMWLDFWFILDHSSRVPEIFRFNAMEVVCMLEEKTDWSSR